MTDRVMGPNSAGFRGKHALARDALHAGRRDKRHRALTHSMKY